MNTGYGDSRPARRPFAAGLLLFAVTLLAYFPALRDGFVWNDPDYVTRADLRPLSGLRRIWLEVGATEQYYPVLHSAFWAEHRLWGDRALGYHLANILLHATAAWLFFLLLRHLFKVERVAPNALVGVAGRTSALGATRSTWDIPLLAALLFALHPVGVESVAWISEQKNTLSTVFYLLAALVYLGGRRAGRRDESPAGMVGSRYVLATGFFVLALLSKSVTATLPAALLVVLWWRDGRLSWRRDVLPLLPWFVLGAADGLFTAWVERRYIGAAGGEFALTFLQRGLVAGRAFWFYLGKLAWPARLIFIYPRWHVDASAAWPYAFPLAALALLAGLWLARRRSRAPLAAALLFLGTLFPVLGFFNVYAFVFSFVADHFQYLACLGALALAAAGLARLLARLPRWLGWGLVVVLFGGLGLRTRGLCLQYRDLPTFYQAILRDNPGAWLAHNNLGNLLRESGRPGDAIAEYAQALQAHPDYPLAENNLGLSLVDTRQAEAALAHYRRALRLEPDYVEAHKNLGDALRLLRRNPEAMAEYHEAIRLRPDYADAYYNLALAERAAGRNREAFVDFQQALRLKPDLPEARDDLGNLFHAAGQDQAAVTQYEQALALRPAYPEALNNLGNALQSLRRLDEAIARFQQALALDPGSAAIHNNLGTCLFAAGRPQEAVVQFEASVRLNPAAVDTQLNLVVALLKTGRKEEAVAHYNEARRLQGRQNPSAPPPPAP